MKQIITHSIALCFAIQINAQPVPVGHLTIFSEDGDKFFLILNGERQNNVAETNLRIEDLNQPYYNAKVIFEDKSMLDISKNYLQIADADGIFQDVTYKIKKDKTGKPKLNYFSMVPVRQGYVAPNNVTVLHYGQPAPPPPAASTTVTQTTTTRANTETVNVNVGMPGVGMNVTIVDPVLGATTTTTTRTTTTTTGYAEPAPTSPPPPVRNEGCRNAYAMNAGDFQSALASINNQGFDETKLSTAKNIASKQCLSTNQIVQICKTFGFE